MLVHVKDADMELPFLEISKYITPTMIRL